MSIYLVCTTMRTGSSLFCSYLADTGLAGNPLDYSNKFYLRQFGVDEPGCQPLTPEYVQQMIDKYTVNDVFGMKLPYQAVIKELADNTLNNLFPTQPMYIYVTRNDKLKQAISLSRAVQTTKFYSTQIPAFEVKEQYSRTEIDAFLRQLETHEYVWRSYFENNHIDPLLITYEALVSNPLQTIKTTLNFIGVKLPKDFALPPARLEKQADSINEEWEKLYKNA
jgi:trehalose 2-sulfotransferase